MTQVPWIAPGDNETPFPDPETFALEEPNGLLAIGGSLTPSRLIEAYAAGIFPWFSEDQPVLWWSPDPRAVIPPHAIHVGRSLRKRLRHSGLSVTLDRAFEAVIRACAAPRADEAGTWITPAMADAYTALHRMGIAHSAEVWDDGRLVGGLYGVSLGAAFFGESMFSLVADASKIALARLAGQLDEWGFGLIDCQLPTPHLERLGAQAWPRPRFLRALRETQQRAQRHGPWAFGTISPLEGASQP
ncbi:Leucyl/phenylalanyl-tRNA--protein transferase [wastewater metagenome]|uniref:Leucyl/phenylalanyl-tRNA--protein transferase n=4 Tax=root TaxID=1 RepID=A0A5B8R8C9_9ZZZZ|nr:leucyl/phenylalanyl-tRNA--protein transferase [Arhodomonas aquaeolei]MCS4503215.1 leucyl/phenylalanyl-tRNA--protein transferase [Arhodomonas aquaeolei]QEA04751.1 leucyl/phenylalanyl-tRNA--protein transferase [uncultured organism]